MGSLAELALLVVLIAFPVAVAVSQRHRLPTLAGFGRSLRSPWSWYLMLGAFVLAIPWAYCVLYLGLSLLRAAPEP